VADLVNGVVKEDGKKHAGLVGNDGFVFVVQGEQVGNVLRGVVKAVRLVVVQGGEAGGVRLQHLRDGRGRQGREEQRGEGEEGQGHEDGMCRCRAGSLDLRAILGPSLPPTPMRLLLVLLLLRAPATLSHRSSPSTYSPSSPLYATTYCTNTCDWAFDNICNDGFNTTTPQYCDYGSDCHDCGQRPGPNPGPLCENTCSSHNNGVCEDGGNGGVPLCKFGTDCADCGPRNTVVPERLPNAPSSSSSLRSPTHSPQNPPPLYSIQLKNLVDIPSDVNALFLAAVERWQQVITQPLPHETYIPAKSFGCLGESSTYEEHRVYISDLLIYVDLAEIDGLGGIIGQAGPCAFDGSYMPRVGLLRLDVDDVQEYLNLGLLLDVIVHEMAHVLGFGTVWQRKKLLEQVGGNGAANNNTTPEEVMYQGQGGAAGLSKVINPNVVFASSGDNGKPIVENLGGSGTALCHWKESVYGTELMTGYINLGVNPLSELTIESLKDLNYQVNLQAADEYVMPVPPKRRRRSLRGDGHHSDQVTRQLTGCVWQGEVQTLESRPKVVG
jgi:hypothetical protein